MSLSFQRPVPVAAPLPKVEARHVRAIVGLGDGTPGHVTHDAAAICAPDAVPVDVEQESRF